MNIFLALLIGLAVNLDNLLIGIHLGLRRQRLTLWQNLVISGTTGLCAFGSVYAARLISGSFLAGTNLIGAAIMIFFGIFCLYQSLTEKEASPSLDASPRFLDILILGFVLAVNYIPPSLAAGAMGLSPWWVGLFPPSSPSSASMPASFWARGSCIIAASPCSPPYRQDC